MPIGSHPATRTLVKNIPQISLSRYQKNVIRYYLSLLSIKIFIFLQTFKHHGGLFSISVLNYRKKIWTEQRRCSIKLLSTLDSRRMAQPDPQPVLVLRLLHSTQRISYEYFLNLIQPVSASLSGGWSPCLSVHFGPDFKFVEGGFVSMMQIVYKDI